jgi:hypothetical protein
VKFKSAKLKNRLEIVRKIKCLKENSQWVSEEEKENGRVGKRSKEGEDKQFNKG